MQQQNTSKILPPTIAEELDRLEVIAGKGGLNAQESAYTLLNGLDAAYREINRLADGSPSRRIAETQFNTIISKMQSEAPQFLRDLGGPQTLQQARGRVQPPADHSWWYLDELVAARRKNRFTRFLLTVAGVGAVLLVLIFVYNRFFAPDPQFVAVYGHEQSARDMLMEDDLESALSEVEQGLAIDPQQVSLLLMKGVITEAKGQTAVAEEAFESARRILNRDVDFYIARGQTYSYTNQPEKALADAQSALALDPQNGQAFLLAGNTYQSMRKRVEALDAYEKAYDAAEARGEIELAALARAQMAFLMQSGGAADFAIPTPVKTDAP